MRRKLFIEIKAPDGTLIYTGNGEEATDFTVNISESGAYTSCKKFLSKAE